MAWAPALCVMLSPTYCIPRDRKEPRQRVEIPEIRLFPSCAHVGLQLQYVLYQSIRLRGIFHMWQNKMKKSSS